MRLLTTACLAVLILFLFLSPVQAAELQFDFTGVLTQVPIDEAFGDFQAGDAFHGSFRFDPAAMDQIPADPASGSYHFLAPLGMELTIGGHMFQATGSLNIGILNAAVDQYTVLALSPSGALTVELFLQDDAGTVFGSDQLPLTAPILALFQQRDFHFDFADSEDGETQLDGQVRTLSSASVPEPASAGLMLAGGVVLGALARRRAARRG